MVDSSCVSVKISHKGACIFDESYSPLRRNDLNDLIQVLRDAQQKSNECLTRLTKETDYDGSTAVAEEKSDISDDDSEEESQSSSARVQSETDNDVSPKRAKLRNE